MKAREIMTTKVVSVSPDAPTREIARILLANGVSAAPVVDADGDVLGMVSEGDLVGRSDLERENRQDWWLALLAEGHSLSPEFLAGLQASRRLARDVMHAPVVSVEEDADVADIARLLASYKIKRVPVLRAGRVVGIVSRADILRLLAGAPAPQPHATKETFFGGALSELDARFAHGERPAPAAAPGGAKTEEPKLSVRDFQNLVVDHDRKETHEQEEARRLAVEHRRARVAELINRHISDDAWRGVLHRAREAAENGQKEYLMLRFPSQLCSDGARAINVGEPDWPTTLRGEAAELYLRWERDLKPLGFRIVAYVLDFPGGTPGDVGLFLVWGSAIE